MEIFTAYIYSALQTSKPHCMRRTYVLVILFLLITTVTFITLTAGITKERYDGGRDMVEEFYDQSLKQNNNLQSIEDGIEKFYRNKEEALEKYNSFTFQNTRYYSDARAKTSTIADSLTKQRAYDLIGKSETTYNNRLNEWKNQINILNARERELKDLYALLKVMITLPSIEKYQSSSMPSDSKLKEINTDLQQVIERIKMLTK